MKNAFLSVLWLLASLSLHAQMYVGNDTLYGNEWINHNQTYLKIPIAEDGIYRITGQALSAAGVPINSLSANAFTLMHLGQAIPLRTSTTGVLSASDYLEFYGQQNRSELDSFLFERPEQDLLNPYYSLFTDTAAYYLTWDANATHPRYQLAPNDLSNPPAPAPYFWHTQVEEYHNAFAKKRADGYIYDSAFLIEGFTRGYSANRQFVVPTPHVYSSGPASTLVTRMAVRDDGFHHQTISIDNNMVLDTSFGGFRLMHYTFPVATSSIGNDVRLRVVNDFDNKDRAAVAYVSLRYPRDFDFDGAAYFEFEIEASNGATYLQIDNFDVTGGAAPLLYDLTEQQYYETVVDANSGQVRVNLPPATRKRELILFNPNTAPIAVNALLPTDFIDFSQLDASYVILSNKRLFSEASTGINWVQRYADYRASAAGGGYTSLVVDVEDLYEQFAYGIARTPQALKNFGHYIVKHWNNPQYVLLMGKAIEYNDLRTANGLAANAHLALVPTHSFVGGDNLLFAEAGKNIPVLPLGRIAAITPADVKLYLEKVQAYEGALNAPQTLADKGWMKRVVHLGGGDPTIQTAIKNSLASMGNILVDSEYGAELITFLKTSADPIQISQTQRLTDLINDGVSVITFFGHSYAGGFDVSLDDPSFYENEGRYPIILSYGCYSGRIHAQDRGISENFVFQEDKGAIAFMSSNGVATVSGLSSFGRAFYEEMGANSYGMGVGDLLRNANIRTQFSTGNAVRQMTLHGDPALRLNMHPGPDYLVDASSVKVTPSVIDIQQDSFILDFEGFNLGSYPQGGMRIRITQELPDGTQAVLLTDSVATFPARQGFQYRLPTLGNVAVGLNRLLITFDVENDIAELPLPAAETNNQLIDASGDPGFPVYFTSSSVTPILPTPFGIVGTPNVTLQATTSNALLLNQRYLFELDTTPLFNSPQLMRHQAVQGGGVIGWTPTLNWQDSTVYYWRVAGDTLADGTITWSSSSFLWLDGVADGWNQSHYYQYADNRYGNMRLDSTRRAIAFIDDFKDLIIKNNVTFNNFDQVNVSLNNQQLAAYLPGVMSGADLFVMVLDSFNIDPWANPPGGLYGSINTHPTRSWNAFPFKASNTSERQTVLHFLDTIVPSGSYVVFLTIQTAYNDSYYPEQWAADSLTLGRNLFSYLEGQGAQRIRTTATRGSVPYLLLYQKDQGLLAELLADTVTQVLPHVEPIAGSWDQGYTQSVTIGPATQWQQLKWRIGDDPTDQHSVTVLAKLPDDSDTILLKGLQSLDTSLTQIDANRYPLLNLRFDALDTTNRSAPTIDYWRIMYQGVPELAVVPQQHYDFYADTVLQGDQVRLSVALQNLSTYPSDSILVRYVTRDAANTQLIDSLLLPPLAGGDTVHAVLVIPTESLSGTASTTLVINADERTPERYRINNTLVQDFYVESDKRHPLLEVTFDGSRIMNGDIVSAAPQILVQLKDENPYLALDDTALFKIWIVHPDGVQRRYFVSDPSVQFYPASAESLSAAQNRARIELMPTFEIDGLYELIIQAEDRSGNASGTVDYKVQFEVINEATISNVLNYPNPFTTATQFVFTLTGNALPDDLRIQIFTVSGRLVREIQQEELGPIKIGLNRTDFRWDGTDQYGDRLANGVYLYRVIARQDGEDLGEHYTPTSRYFKNGFGKMVLLR